MGLTVLSVSLSEKPRYMRPEKQQSKIVLTRAPFLFNSSRWGLKSSPVIHVSCMWYLSTYQIKAYLNYSRQHECRITVGTIKMFIYFIIMSHRKSKITYLIKHQTKYRPRKSLIKHNMWTINFTCNSKKS